MQAAIADLDVAAYTDAQAHCLAAGSIALRCSRIEAWLASYGKEIKDLLGRGTAEWRDLEADRRGIKCAQTATLGDELVACCRSAP